MGKRGGGGGVNENVKRLRRGKERLVKGRGKGECGEVKRDERGDGTE